MNTKTLQDQWTELRGPMTTSLNDLASGLSAELKETIQVQDDCIVLTGLDPSDHAVLQLGANDGALYLSASIVKITDTDDLSSEYLNILLELNSDTKNYPYGRIALDSLAESATWIERIEPDIDAQRLIQIIEARGLLIARIRLALQAVARG